MSKQRAHWCLTIPEEYVLEHFEEKGRTLFLNAVGKKEGVPLPYTPDYVYTMIVGCLEGPDDNTKTNHYHVLLSNPKGKASTKGRCITVLELNNMITKEPIYIQELQSKVEKYIDYIFKESPTYKSNNTDGILVETMSKLKHTGCPITREKYFDLLLTERGATWCTKNKSIIDTYTSNTALFNNSRIVRKQVNNRDVLERAEAMISSFHDTILNNINEYGVITDHSILKEADNETMAHFITIQALLPFLFQRCEEVDNIPGLYLWGQPASGKSFLFQSGKSYKHLANDASGVGRFKLDGVESAIFIDDAKQTTIDQDNNMTTLRVLALGGTSRVKIHSDTKSINAFIVVTSNDKPAYLTTDMTYDKNQALAWKRRFLTLQMNKKNFVDFAVSSGNEMDYQCTQVHIAKFITKLIEFMKLNENNTKIINLLQVYLDQCYNIIKQDEELDNQLAIEAIIKDEEEEEKCKRKAIEEEEKTIKKCKFEPTSD